MQHPKWSSWTRQPTFVNAYSHRRYGLVGDPYFLTANGSWPRRFTHLSRLQRPVSHTSRRSFSQKPASRAAGPYDPSNLLLEAVPEYSFSVKPKEILPQQKKSQIRDSLRTWSRQNERAKLDQQPESLPYEGKITIIPNSLFLDAEERESLDERRDTDETGDAEEEASYRGGSWLQPGTLIRHSSENVRAQDAIYLGDIGVQSILLLSNGKWAAERLVMKRLGTSSLRGVAIPDFITLEEIKTLQDYMPKQDVRRAIQEGVDPVAVDVTGSMPYEVVDPILAKMKAFREAGDRFLRDHRLALERTYDTLAYQDQWRTISLTDVPSLVLDIDYAKMKAIEKRALVGWLEGAHPGIHPIQTTQTLTLYIAPKSFDESIKLVQEWARLYQEAAAQAAIGKNVSGLLSNNPLTSFIEKARRSIVKSRKIRPPTTLGVLGPVITEVRGSDPVQKVPTGEEFTSDDVKIIDYLSDCAFRLPFTRYSLAHAALIARAVGAYPGAELVPATLRMLLAELGCADPWSLPTQLQAPLPGARTAWALDQLRREAAATTKPLLDRGEKESPFMDSMAELRKDWGDLEGYCIDKAFTINVEDAISVEPAHEIEGGYWIRGHIVHPTAHFDVNHPVARAARKQGCSYFEPYEGEVTLPMVPQEIISEFSLTKKRPVLTISTLITPDGIVHDVEIVPGTLRNIKRLDRKLVNKAMGIDKDDVASVLVVGKVGDIPDSFSGKRDQDISKEELQSISSHLPQLSLLQELFEARRQRRLLETERPVHLSRRSFKLFTHTKLPGIRRAGRERESYHWNDDPGIIVIGGVGYEKTNSWMDHRADDLTAQAMRLISESLGSWLSDRHIPAVYLGVELPPGHSMDELGQTQLGREMELPIFTRTCFPRPNHVHNIKQHVAGTSPLRRFTDMIAHFQVDSYLKAEAAGLVKPGARVEDDSILAFSKADVQDYLDQDAAVSDTLDDLSRRTSRFWAGQALFRAFHFREATLPDVMEVNVTKPARRNATGLLENAEGRLLPFYIGVTLAPSPEGYENLAKIDDFLPVKLIEVNPSGFVAVARAVGPPTGEQQFVEPLRCYTEDNLLRTKKSSGST